MEYRFHQKLIVNKTLFLIEKKETNFLWAMKCRSGKSYTLGLLIYELSKKMDKINILIITPVPNETFS